MRFAVAAVLVLGVTACGAATEAAREVRRAPEGDRDQGAERLPRRDLCARPQPPDLDGVRSRRPPVRLAGRRHGRPRRSRHAEAEGDGEGPAGSARPRLDRPAPLHLRPGPRRSAHARERSARLAARARLGASVRPPPAEQHRRRPRRAPVLRQRLHVRRLQGEEQAQRHRADDEGRRIGSPRPRARSAQRLRSRVPPGDGPALRNGQRPRRPRHERARRDARAGEEGRAVRLAVVLAELAGKADEGHVVRRASPARSPISRRTRPPTAWRSSPGTRSRPNGKTAPSWRSGASTARPPAAAGSCS